MHSDCTVDWGAMRDKMECPISLGIAWRASSGCFLRCVRASRQWWEGLLLNGGN